MEKNPDVVILHCRTVGQDADRGRMETDTRVEVLPQFVDVHISAFSEDIAGDLFAIDTDLGTHREYGFHENLNQRAIGITHAEARGQRGAIRARRACPEFCV